MSLSAIFVLSLLVGVPLLVVAVFLWHAARVAEAVVASGRAYLDAVNTPNAHGGRYSWSPEQRLTLSDGTSVAFPDELHPTPQAPAAAASRSEGLVPGGGGRPGRSARHCQLCERVGAFFRPKRPSVATEARASVDSRGK